MTVLTFYPGWTFTEKRGKKHGLSKKEEMKKLSKNGFPHFLSQKDIQKLSISQFSTFFTFPLHLALT